MAMKGMMAILIAFFVWLQVVHIDRQIEVKETELVSLEAEIDQARELGIAETMEYVEKIGLARQIEDEIQTLKDKKARLESAAGGLSHFPEGVKDRGR